MEYSANTKSVAEIGIFMENFLDKMLANAFHNDSKSQIISHAF